MTVLLLSGNQLWPTQVLEYLEKGQIADARKSIPFLRTKIRHPHFPRLEAILTSDRFRSLKLFNTVYGIGPVTARRLYNLGLRTFEDLLLYYDVKYHEDEDCNVRNLDEVQEANTDPDRGIRESLRLHSDLTQK